MEGEMGNRGRARKFGVKTRGELKEGTVATIAFMAFGVEKVDDTQG